MKNALFSIAGALFLSGMQLFGTQHAKPQPNDKENPERYHPPEEKTPAKIPTYPFVCCKQDYAPELILTKKPSRYQKRRWHNSEIPNPQKHERNPRASRKAIQIKHYRR